MTKKWLYSVAVGALLIAGEAMGITVHDVLSNGFFSSEILETREHLARITDWKSFLKKEKMIQDEDGKEKRSFVYINKAYAMESVQWKNKSLIKQWTSEDEKVKTWEDVGKLVARRPLYREKGISDQYRQENYGSYFLTNEYLKSTGVYTNKPCKKEARPVGPFVVEDWFPDKMATTSYKNCRFFGTEHNAVTNVISDNEAYITGTISQTGHIDKYDGEKVNRPASLLRTYTQHITTDADHVYVEQEITENAQNAPQRNSQATWQTQYTATFKKGRWKGSTETFSQTQNSQLADWRLKQLSQNSR